MKNIRTCVVKLGGSIHESKDTTALDLVALSKLGTNPVVVHGGAQKVTGWLSAMGIQTHFFQGERITDQPTMDVVTAVLCGLANKETVAAIIKAGGLAVGISGVDGSLFEATIRDPHCGLVGNITRVNHLLLKLLLEKGYIPVVSPVSVHAVDGSVGVPPFLNVNGDTAAGHLAAALQADRLIFLTDVDGIRDSSGKFITQINPGELGSMLESNVITGGMIPKVKAAILSASSGTPCNIVDGRRRFALREALSGLHPGTLIKAE